MALSPSQLRKFHTRGFLVLEDAVPAQLTDALCSECERLLRTYRISNLIEQGAGCILGTVVWTQQLQLFYPWAHAGSHRTAGRAGDRRQAYH